MTTSRLKFELVDSVESIGSENCRSPDVLLPTLIGSRHSADVMKDQLAQLKESVDRSQQSNALRAALSPSVLDASLLRDLAEGLENLHHQMDDSESELNRSREQSRSFENDARRWEQASARLQQDALDTRAALRQLRLEFEESRECSHQQNAAVQRIVDEMAHLRAARNQLEHLAAEQQRALVLSLELLKRVDAAERVDTKKREPLAELPEPSPGLNERINEIAEPKCLSPSGDRRSIQVDGDLAEFCDQLQGNDARGDPSQAESMALRLVLEQKVAELDSAYADLADFKAQVQAGAVELRLAREELAQLADNSEINEEKAENARIAKHLADAEAEIALQNAEVDSRGAIILALENALEEQNTSLRELEERFLSYAEQVQSLNVQRLPQAPHSWAGIAWKFSKLFSPPRKRGNQ